MKNTFRYTGESIENGYKNNKIYLLEVNGFRRPFVIAPFGSHYATWEDFFAEWERV